MDRGELERLSKAELIELVLRLQRPEKTSRTSSKPPSADRKERREQAKPGGAKAGHEGHSRALSTNPDRVVDHAPQQCPCCRVALSPDLPSEAVSVHERIELPEVKPIVEHHRRLAVRCPGCGARVVAGPPPAATGTPCGPRLHAVATYLKTCQSLSYCVGPVARCSSPDREAFRANRRNSVVLRRAAQRSSVFPPFLCVSRRPVEGVSAECRTTVSASWLADVACSERPLRPWPCPRCRSGRNRRSSGLVF